MRDFTFFAYEELLKEIKRSNLPVFGIKAFYEQKPQVGVVLRHDVDRNAKNSLYCAQLEASYGIFSTYYFRMTSGSFDPEIIKQISQLGHEIGYHYEDLSDSRGNIAKAIDSFHANLSKLRKLTQINTAAMHGRPLLPWDNRDIFKSAKLSDFGLCCEAFLSIDYTEIYYVTDTGRSWASDSANLRDKTTSLIAKDIVTTSDLIKFINSHPSSKIAIVMHPERWSSSWQEWLLNLTKDKFINFAKIIAKNIFKLIKAA